MNPTFDKICVDVPHVETKHRRICTPIPNKESIAMIEEMEKYETYSNMGQPLVIWHHTEDGYKVCDPFGNKWIDFSSAILITNAGHANPAIQEAVHKVVDKPMMAAYLFPTEERIEAARELISVCPIPDPKVFMLSAGTEACECALKLMRTYGAKKSPTKKVIVTFKDAFHGRTLGAQILGGMPELKTWITNPDPDLFQAPWPNSYEYKWADPESPEYDEDKMFGTFLETIDAHGVRYQDICGVMIESYHAPLCHPMPVSFAKKLRAFCDEHDALLCMDEIQIGACRSGKFWCFENYGMIPDMFTAAKGMSGALPQSAIFGRRDVMDMYGPQQMTSTHSGSPVASAATAANIRFLRDNRMWEVAAEKGKIIERRMKEIKKKYSNRVGYVGGIGMGWNIHFSIADKLIDQPEFTRAVITHCIEKGLMFSIPNNHGCSLRVVPPLTIPTDALEEGLDVLEEAIAQADAEFPEYQG